MSRKKGSNGGGGKFKRLLGWTVLMAIVFSAGLITGERLVRRQMLDPLVSVDDQVERVSDEDAENVDADDAPEKETTFAFFDQLTRKDDVALSSTRKSQKVAAEKPSKKEATKPEAKEEAKVEAKKAQTPAEKRAASEKEPAAKAPAAPAVEKPADVEPADEKASEEIAARYTLQVAAHPDMDSAKAHMERLRKMGLEPHLISAAIPGKGKFYRVRVGKFGSMDEARAFQANLKRKNSLSTFVSPL